MRGLLAVLALIVACGGDDSGEVERLREEVADLRQQLAESPTAEPFSEAVEEAASQIEAMLATAQLMNSTYEVARLLETDLGQPRDDTADFLNGLATRERGGCESIPVEPFRSFRQSSSLGADLWPRTYAQINTLIVAKCTILLGLPLAIADGTYLRVSAATDDGDLGRLLDALPDYSRAQLRRALAERE